MERIIIENFGGIPRFTFELNRINLFIGPQATGKSICAKLLYFFKRFDSEIVNSIELENNRKEFEKLLLKKFEEYFPPHTYSKETFTIRYELKDLFVEVKRSTNNKTEVNYSDFYKKEYNTLKNWYKRLKEKNQNNEKFDLYKPQIELREKYFEKVKNEIGQPSGFNQLFIPAGRSFFANLQSNIFSFLSSNKSIDPFLIEFGSFYESMKGFSLRSHEKEREKEINASAFSDALIEKILNGKYIREKGTDYLIHRDGRKINIAYSSSGQQETLPLAIILKSLLNIRFVANGATIYIEEPEAHLFPSAQKLIVEFISFVYNVNKSQYQFVITTHSPYILTSFNNLIQAGIIRNNIKESDLPKLYEKINKNIVLNPNNVYAYSLSDGCCNTLINKETQLISSNILDSVSEELTIQFDDILNLLDYESIR